MKKSKNNIKKTKHIKYILLWTLSLFFLILSFIFDKQIIAAIQAARNPVLDAFFSFILLIETNFIFYPLIIILPILLLWKKKKFKFILPFILSIALTALISFLFKIVVARPRPLSLTKDSFPSGHAGAAFTPLPFLDKLKCIQTAWLVIACLFAFTRVWFGLHYLSDVIAGAALGYAIAFVVKKTWLTKAGKSRQKIK